MKSYIKLIFGTNSGNDLVLTVSDADETVNAAKVALSMTDILLANVIDGAKEITSAKAASLYKAETKAFTVA